MQSLFSEGISGNIYYNFPVAGITFLALGAFLNTIINKNETKQQSEKRKQNHHRLRVFPLHTWGGGKVSSGRRLRT